MKIEGFLKQQLVIILIDTGSTINFMNSKVAARLMLLKEDCSGQSWTLSEVNRTGWTGVRKPHDAAAFLTAGPRSHSAPSALARGALLIAAAAHSRPPPTMLAATVFIAAISRCSRSYRVLLAAAAPVLLVAIAIVLLALHLPSLLYMELWGTVESGGRMEEDAIDPPLQPKSEKDKEASSPVSPPPACHCARGSNRREDEDIDR
ncbi:hypothetical protein BHM03_00036130 [Ensete ventricosum]|nr:hypothetical protein BHM03_00036130 [Ensete ventricosum]